TVLIAGAAGTNISDFADEFATYWARLGGSKYDSVLEPGREVRAIVIGKTRGDHGVIAGSREELTAFYNGSLPLGKFEILEGLYLPLEVGAAVVPPTTAAGMW